MKHKLEKKKNGNENGLSGLELIPILFGTRCNFIYIKKINYIIVYEIFSILF